MTRSLGHFTKIEVKNGILVQLIKGDREAVLIKVQEIPINDVITEISDGLLTVRYQAPLFSKSKVMVNIYYRELKSVSASGKSEVTSTSLMKQDSLNVYLEGGARAYLDLDVRYLKSHVTEGALISADGYAVKQDAYATLGATLSLFDLESDVVNVKVTANGKAKLNVDKILNADASTGGYISYKGKPAVKDFSSSIGGKVEPYSE